jgi:hypothetical protein
LLSKCETRGKGFTKQPSSILLINKNSCTLNAQKSQRSLILNTHNSSDCSSKTAKPASRTKDLHFRGETSRSKANSREKPIKTSLSKVIMKKEEKKTILPTNSYKIKLT